MGVDFTEWILSRVKNEYGETLALTSIQALRMFMELETGSVREAVSMEEMRTASDEVKPLRIKNFSNIELFMKALGRIVKPDQLFPDGPESMPMLGKLYGSIFHVAPSDVNLPTADPEEYANAPGYLKHYLIVYQFRNSLCHDDEVDLSPDNINRVTNSTLICKLDLCHRYSDALERCYKAKKRKDSFDGKAYTRDICKAYQQETQDGFGYLDLQWTEARAQSKALTVANLLEHKELTRVKLLGEAGTGKSTALKRAEYLLARAYKGAMDAPVPIYVELVSLADQSNMLLTGIAEIMGVEAGIAKGFLQNGEIFLLLDGFNEVLDISAKKRLASELDAFGKDYPKTRIFLTDRAVARASIPAMEENTRKFYLWPISLKQKKTYFEENCRDEEALGLIKERINDPDGAGYFELMNTPLKLKRLAEVTVYRKALPEDLTDEYLRYLMDRESNEKKDENIEYLSVFLQALALLPGEEMSEFAALAQMAKCKAVYGFSRPDTKQCLKLAVDMGILTYEEGNHLSFTSREYATYFLMEATSNELTL